MLHHRTIDPSGSRRGVALLAVLAVLALLTILVVAFLMRAQSARNAAANYRNTTNTRLLADTVVNLVEAEINDATTYGSSSGAGGTGPYTWASQPGAIRVYDSSGSANANGGGTGFQKIYRLYSAPSLTTSNITDILNVDTTPTGAATDLGGTVKTSGSTPEINASWATLPAQWVDLNAPATVTDPSTASTFTIYPILDNRNPNNTAQCVQLPGFYVNTLTATTPPYPLAAASSPTTLNPPVMPVRWLYVLQNGQLVAPTGGTGAQVTFTAPNAPTASNPIVGRVAYWTDDDTCKININTAGGSAAYRPDNSSNPVLVGDGSSSATKVFFSASGTAGNINAWPPAPWDTPHFAGSWEDIRLLAADQPVAGEYQRYPGHPATTTLYYVLRALGVSIPEMLAGNLGYTSSITSTIGSDTQNGGCAVWPHTSSAYGLLPRYNDNAGSQGGLAETVATNPPAAISTNRSRLYTSIGELLYSTNASSATPPVRTQNGTLNGATTPATPFLNRQQIETGKFFLTAHSRAPEITLFGTPRVCIWPIPDTSQTPTQGTKMAESALDKLIAFCTTTDTGTTNPGNAYYFKRYDANSSTNDWANEARNHDVYGYLQDLTSGGASNQNIPGYAGGSFVTKYGSSLFTSGSATIANERDQILTEMVDYIRCTNLNDHSWTGTFTTNPLPSGTAVYTSRGEVMPLQITGTATSSRTASTTQGLGRLLTLSEIGVQVICTADGNNNLGSYNTSAAVNPNPNVTYAANSTSPVPYNPPVMVTTANGYPANIPTTYPVSPVKGSANDAAYVSNLPVAQYLRDINNNIVDRFGNTISTATAENLAVNAPFPYNPTLSAVDPTLKGAYPTSASPLAATSYLPIGSKILQAMLIFEPASPMLGFDQINQGGTGPDVNILVNGIQNIGFAQGATNIFPFPNRTKAQSAGTAGYIGPNVNGNGYMDGPSAGNVNYAWVNHGDNDQGGIFGFRFPLDQFDTSASANTATSSRCNGWSGVAGLTKQAATGTTTLGTSPTTMWFPSGQSGGVGGYNYSTWATTDTFTAPKEPYRFVSNPFTVSSTASLTLGGDTGSSLPFTVQLTLPVTKSGVVSQVPYQTYNVAFTQITMSLPTLPQWGFSATYTSSNNNTYTTYAPDWWGFDNRVGWCSQGSPFFGSGGTNPGTLGLGCVIRGDNAPPAAGAWLWKGSVAATLSTQAVSYGDVLRTIVPRDCDYRLSMARYSSGTTTMLNADPNTGSSNPDYVATGSYTSSNLIYDLFMEPAGSNATAGVDTSGALINFAHAPATSPKVPSTYAYGPNPQSSWDWDNGYASAGTEGAYANKPDEGNTYVSGSNAGIPYISNIGSSGSQGNGITSYFTANRIITSPVAFCSLPTGVAEGISWRNLLFRPQLTVSQGGKRTNGAPGAVASSITGPEDELLLDNFWMPVVQPYAISEPFSTAGKINMNYQILPFTYITRSTGVQAVLASELIPRVPGNQAINPGGNSQALYQSGGIIGNTGVNLAESTLYTTVTQAGTKLPMAGRLPLNLNDTNGSLRQFRARFMTGDIFRSAAEICDVYLVPRDSLNTGYYYDWYNTTNLLDNSNADYNKPDAWYGSRGDFALVGNNVRTKPYSDIYPRLTTKSNTYTVYYRVQVLKNPPGADPTQWTDGQGVVTGEYRGSTAIERYLDPNNNNIPDYTDSTKNPAVTPNALSLDSYYQWRTVSNTAFAP